MRAPREIAAMVRGGIGFVVVMLDLDMPTRGIVPGDACVPSGIAVIFLEDRRRTRRLLAEQDQRIVRQPQMVQQTCGTIAESPTPVGDHYTRRVVPAQTGRDKLQRARADPPVERAFGADGAEFFAEPGIDRGGCDGPIAGPSQLGVL